LDLTRLGLDLEAILLNFKKFQPGHGSFTWTSHSWWTNRSNGTGIIGLGREKIPQINGNSPFGSGDFYQGTGKPFRVNWLWPWFLTHNGPLAFKLRSTLHQKPFLDTWGTDFPEWKKSFGGLCVKKEKTPLRQRALMKLSFRTWSWGNKRKIYSPFISQGPKAHSVLNLTPRAKTGSYLGPQTFGALPETAPPRTGDLYYRAGCRTPKAETTSGNREDRPSGDPGYGGPLYGTPWEPLQHNGTRGGPKHNVKFLEKTHPGVAHYPQNRGALYAPGATHEDRSVGTLAPHSGPRKHETRR